MNERTEPQNMQIQELIEWRIKIALDRCDGHRMNAANDCGVSKATLYKYLKVFRDKPKGSK